MKSSTVLITAPVEPVLVTSLQQAGFGILYKPSSTREEIFSLIREVEGLIVTTRMPIDKEILQNAGNLKWIGRLGSGMELIDSAYAEERGIICISTPEGNRNSVAEHTLGLILNLNHNISRAFEEVKNGIWKRRENTGTELRGKKVGIIGFGNTGSQLARLLSSFDCTVLGYDRYKSGFANNYTEEVTLEKLCADSDIVSLHLPLTDETFHFADGSFFSGLSKKPLFISTCRGKVTHTSALLNALENNQIRGAGLDVLENEVLTSYSGKEREELRILTNHANVIVTPHIAGYSHEAFTLMGEVLLEKLRRNHLLS